MSAYRFVQVDAFADRPFAGNPAAVIVLERWLDGALLQRIAAENNLSETAFIVPDPGQADYELRWFSPTNEVALCGHATLASGHVLLSDDPGRQRIRFSTRTAGVLEVARTGAGYALALPAMAPAPRPLPQVTAALGVTAVATLWHPARYAVVVVGSAAEVRGCTPDLRALAAMGDWLFILTAPGEQTDIVTRAFAPGNGVDEDPVTGSAHAVVVPYWAERIGRATLTAYQASARGGRIGCTLAGDRVVLTGACVTVIEGVLRI